MIGVRKQYLRKRARRWVIPFLLGCFVGYLIYWYMTPQTVRVIFSPVPTPTPTAAPRLLWRGTASYYSEADCLGCSPTLIMANGERLDDDVATIAMAPGVVREYQLLNRTVTVQNEENGAVTRAKVSDTGGFERHGRIADLSVAVKRSIRCSDLCEIIITAD